MSKGLETFYKFCDEINACVNSGGIGPIDIRKKEIIEKELIEKAKFDAFMKRYNIDSVEELDAFFNEHLNNDIDKCSKCKELKALEIIRNIGILRPYETSGGQCWLEAMCDATKITKQNYDLLKEELL